jgi:DNA-binding response OmpR family regulator
MRHTRLPHPDVAVLAGADPVLLDILKAVLMEEAHFHVITVTAPGLVVSLIETTAPGVVILDLNLPGPSGWDILTALRQHTGFGALPVLMLSPVDEDAARVAAQHDAWVELILKPFDLETVLQRTQHLVQQQRGDTREPQQRKVDAVGGTSLSSISPLLLLGDTGK